jgi:ATP-dependent protease HslVU (ClpYQ) peptidase subunit
MTCIVGYIDKENKTMYLGGDSAGVAGLHIRSRKDVKVFKKGDMLIGYTSSFRMGQLLRYKLVIPLFPEEMDVYEYMCTLFIDSVRMMLIDNGYAKKENNTESIGYFLVAFRGRLFQIMDDLQVGENNYPYDATGCGEVYALGAMKGIELNRVEPASSKEFVQIALEVASEFSAGVRSPFTIEKLSY